MDGGGIKGLIQVEILSQMEEATGRKITELFDWIVGTSTGGIIALLMVYGKLADIKRWHNLFEIYIPRIMFLGMLSCVQMTSYVSSLYCS